VLLDEAPDVSPGRVGHEASKARVLLEQKSIAAAKKIQDQCEKALKERNKIIRIADEYGWDVKKKAR
jgi:hypothetical protein